MKTLCIFFLFWFLSIKPVQCREMSNEELAATSARGVEVQSGGNNLDFSFSGFGKPEFLVNGSGNLTMTQGRLLAPQSTVLLQDSAQSNLRSVVNINAANSYIQVLLNLNVNINSQVGTVLQLNNAALR